MSFVHVLSYIQIFIMDVIKVGSPICTLFRNKIVISKTNIVLLYLFRLNVILFWKESVQTNGFDYPNDLCVQNALWCRLAAIEILQIRLD